jgi:hypothetical protein
MLAGCWHDPPDQVERGADDCDRVLLKQPFLRIEAIGGPSLRRVVRRRRRHVFPTRDPAAPRVPDDLE